MKTIKMHLPVKGKRYYIEFYFRRTISSTLNGHFYLTLVKENYTSEEYHVWDSWRQVPLKVIYPFAILYDLPNSPDEIRIRYDKKELDSPDEMALENIGLASLKGKELYFLPKYYCFKHRDYQIIKPEIHFVLKKCTEGRTERIVTIKPEW